MRINQSTVDARNAVNRQADETEGHLIRILSPYQGKKVWKMSGYGGLVAKLEKELGTYRENHNVKHPWRLIVRSDVSWITAELSLWTQEAGYTKETLFLGKRDDSGVLTELGECQKRQIYDLEEVQLTESMIYDLEKQARELEKTISCFKY